MAGDLNRSARGCIGGSNPFAIGQRARGQCVSMVQKALSMTFVARKICEQPPETAHIAQHVTSKLASRAGITSGTHICQTPCIHIRARMKEEKPRKKQLER